MAESPPERIMVTPLPAILDEMDANAAAARQAAIDAQYAADEANKAAANVKTALDAAKEELREEFESELANSQVGVAEEFRDVRALYTSLGAKLEALDDVVIAVVLGLMTKADGSSKSWQSLIDQLKAKGFDFKE